MMDPHTAAVIIWLTAENSWRLEQQEIQRVNDMAWVLWMFSEQQKPPTK